MEPTTSSQNGSTPKPGIASRTNPGSSSHCRPSTMNRRSAVTTSITHAIGGAAFAKAPRASEAAEMAKARTSVFLEKRTVLEDGVATSVGGLPELILCLRSVGQWIGSHLNVHGAWL